MNERSTDRPTHGPDWHDAGAEADLLESPVRTVTIGRTRIALSHRDGVFGAISGVCNHAGGPLGEGGLVGDYIKCPWHNWKYHRVTGEGEPGYEQDRVPRHEVRVEQGRVLVSAQATTTRNQSDHEPHALERPLGRADGPLRVLGISTTAMDRDNPRYSTSEALLQVALDHAAEELAAETRLVRLDELSFRACEGYYSKSAHACTWPCSITQMDPDDEMDRVYEGLVFWADVVLVATPIRWGAPSSLYFKMAERLNCVQNQVTLRNRVMIRNKVVSFIITGGQDNVQAVAGQMLTFFSELGFAVPAFPFVAHSRGWTAEDMERNVAFVRESEELRTGARELVERAAALSHILLEHDVCHPKVNRGGRKGSGRS